MLYFLVMPLYWIINAVSNAIENHEIQRKIKNGHPTTRAGVLIDFGGSHTGERARSRQWRFAYCRTRPRPAHAPGRQCFADWAFGLPAAFLMALPLVRSKGASL
jgi:hypothetical protein